MNIIARWVTLSLLAAWVVTVSGCCCCGGRDTTRKTTPNVSVPPGSVAIKKIAVMPFKASTELIGSSVGDMFVTEILGSGIYELCERSQMGKVLSESELAMAGLSASKAVEVGSMVGAEAVVIGTVDEYSKQAYGQLQYAVVSITARLIDCKTGKIIWSVDYACKADQTDTTVSEHARQVIREMITALKPYLVKAQ